MKFHPLKGKVLVKPDEPVKVVGGILLVDPNEPQVVTGKVVALPRKEE